MFTVENDVTCAEFDIRRLCLHSPAKGEAMDSVPEWPVLESHN